MPISPITTAEYSDGQTFTIIITVIAPAIGISHDGKFGARRVPDNADNVLAEGGCGWLVYGSPEYAYG
jgi:hypothetical protein